MTTKPLLAYFWSNPAVVRFGLVDELRGWRMTQPPAPAGRRPSDTLVAAFGTDFAVTTTAFAYPGQPPGGRARTLARTSAGWRIAPAPRT